MTEAIDKDICQELEEFDNFEEILKINQQIVENVQLNESRGNSRIIARERLKEEKDELEKSKQESLKELERRNIHHEEQLKKVSTVYELRNENVTSDILSEVDLNMIVDNDQEESLMPERVITTSTCSTVIQASEMAPPKPPRSFSPPCSFNVDSPAGKEQLVSKCSNGSSVFAMENSKCEGRDSVFSSGSTRVVLLAVDPTENSKMAFDWYVENIWRNDDCLVLLYVAKPPARPMTMNALAHFEKSQANLNQVEEKTTEILKYFEDTCYDKKIIYKVNRKKSDEPGIAIIGIADEVNADVILMGTRGMGTVAKFLKSSVSDYVMQNTNKPLIVIPGTKMRKAEEKRHSTTSINSLE